MRSCARAGGQATSWPQPPLLLFWGPPVALGGLQRSGVLEKTGKGCEGFGRHEQKGTFGWEAWKKLNLG